jgi:ribosomal protein L37E
MVVDNFQVLFSGQVKTGASQGVVRARLMRHLGVDARKAEVLFSGRTVVIQSELSRAAAERLQAELGELGAVTRIKDRTPPDEEAKFKDDNGRPDPTLKDITAAHVECARCGHLQLESEHCTRCGVDMAAARKQKRKEDLIIEKKIRELREQRTR